MSKENITSNLKAYVPKPQKKRRYYTLAELRIHNCANDAWVVFFNDIYNITQLIQQRRQSEYIQPLIKAAGTDISHWFQKMTKQPKKCINSEGKIEFYCPYGRYQDLSDDQNFLNIPWWKNQKYFIGKLTEKSQYIRIINTLSDTQDTLEVPRQQTIWEILDRYEEINFHAKSYTWKRKGKILNMDATLSQNGIVDQSDIFKQYEVPQKQQYIPAIHVHFNDDLTIK